MITIPTTKHTINKPAHLWQDLGPLCSYHQATFSVEAHRQGVRSNTPTEAQYRNMQLTYRHIIVPVAEHFGIAPHINSFFRNPIVNAIVKGSATSDHMSGRAVDLDYDLVKGGPTNVELFAWIRQNLSFDQLIAEVPNAQNNPAWVHASWRGGAANRKQIKRMIYVKGEKVYQRWPWK